MEEDISDDIYGDLGDFEFNEKLKENCQKIEELRDQLNQSKDTIADLETKMKALTKLHLELEKNSSSLLATARLELSRKDRNIGMLQQTIDNRAFRRPNNYSIGIQTNVDADVTGDLLISQCNGTNVNGSEPLLRQPMNDLSKFRIPKKNPFARQGNDKEHRDQISACNERDNEPAQYEPIRQLPKKNPYARRHEEKDRLKDPRDEIRNNRKHFTHDPKERRDYKKRSSSSHDRKRDRSGNNRKRGRSSSDETDRHAKRSSDSSPSRQRSRSRPIPNEDKVTKAKAKSPTKRQLKRGKGDRVEEIKRNETNTNLEEKDLEAILIAQKKILYQIDSEQHEKSSKEHRKRTSSSGDDRATLLTNQEGQQSEQHEKSSMENRKQKTKPLDQEGQQDKLSEKSSKEHQKRESSKTDDPTTIATSQEIQQSALPETSSKEHRKRKGLNTDDATTSMTTNLEGQQVELPRKSSKEHRKRKHSSNDDPATTTKNQEQAEQTETSSKEHRSRKCSITDDRATMSTNQEEQQTELPEKSSKENSKPKNSTHHDHATMTGNQDGIKDLSSANDARSAEVMAEPKNTIEVLSVETAVNPKTSNVTDASPETKESFPVTPEGSIQLVSLEEANPTSESTDEKVIAEAASTVQLPIDEKSNSPMDIDYELMEHRLVENQTNLPIEETQLKSCVEDSMTPTVSKKVTCDETITATGVAVHQDNSLSSSLNSSQERHSLSKSSEYTVEDAGFEIRIFLTKKRRKNKNAKVTS